MCHALRQSSLQVKLVVLQTWSLVGLRIRSTGTIWHWRGCTSSSFLYLIIYWGFLVIWFMWLNLMSYSSFQNLFIVLLGWSASRQLLLKWMLWESQCVNCSHFFFLKIGNWMSIASKCWGLIGFCIETLLIGLLYKLPYLKDAQAKWKIRFDCSGCMCIMFCMNFRERKNLILSESNTV